MTNSTKRCKHCGDYFKTWVTVPAGTFCTIEHATDFAKKKTRQKQERQHKAQEKKTRAERRTKKQELKSLSTICSEAQRYVNAMILAADKSMGYRCIATGREIQHAGHYVHAGSKYRISWLRFYHANIHGQHGESNAYKGGDSVNYRAGLVERYGEQYVSELEEFKLATDRGEIPKPTREEVAGMVKWCKAMTKIYKDLAH